jgi:hypothetical protein
MGGQYQNEFENNKMRGDTMDVAGLGQGPVAVPFEDGDEPSGSVNIEEFLDHLNDC